MLAVGVTGTESHATMPCRMSSSPRPSRLLWHHQKETPSLVPSSQSGPDSKLEPAVHVISPLQQQIIEEAASTSGHSLVCAGMVTIIYFQAKLEQDLLSYKQGGSLIHFLCNCRCTAPAFGCNRLVCFALPFYLAI